MNYIIHLASRSTIPAITPAIYITDTRNNRILGWRSAQATPGAPADIILGQSNQYQTFAGGPGTISSLGLNAPTGIAVDPLGNVYVADSNNNRILRFPTPLATAVTPTTPILPDLIIGQPGFTTNGANQGGISASTISIASGTAVPLFAGLAFDTAGSLYVSDVGNNRVLVFPASVLKSQTFGPAATLVLGQVNFTSRTAALNGLSSSGFALPSGITLDSKGRLYVGDSLGRVLVFLPPFVLGSNAARLVGIQTQITGQQAPPAISNTTVGYPQGVAIAGNRLVVVDAADSRALVFDPYENWPDPAVTFSPAAYEIIGQSGYSDHTQNRGAFLPTASTLSFPAGAATSATELFIADGSNNRVAVYENPERTADFWSIAHIWPGLPQCECAEPDRRPGVSPGLPTPVLPGQWRSTVRRRRRTCMSPMPATTASYVSKTRPV